MKSLLVDALRNARNGDEANALSDSGSHDTTRGDFFATANDAVVGLGTASDQELTLYETVVQPKASLKHQSIGQRPEPLSGVPLTSGPVGYGQRLARIAPLGCILLALFAASTWLAYQRLQSGYADVGLGMFQQQTADAISVGSDANADKYIEARFPYLPDAVDSLTPESGE